MPNRADMLARNRNANFRSDITFTDSLASTPPPTPAMGTTKSASTDRSRSAIMEAMSSVSYIIFLW